MKKIGFTSTIPVEILLAAKKTPVDLNNIFITSKNPDSLIDFAEMHGFPRNFCCWIKGLYSAVKKNNIKTVIGVYEGDCSTTRPLCEVLCKEGVSIIPFSYPYNRDEKEMYNKIKNLMNIFKVTWDELFVMYNKIQNIREKIYLLDELKYKENIISSTESHLWQVSATDFNSNLKAFDKNITNVLKKKNKQNSKKSTRIAYLGVPPITLDLFSFIDSCNASIVFHEVARQFTFPFLKGRKITKNKFKEFYVQQYLNYTYPYDMKFRLKDIKKELKERRVQGVVHYVQSFCYKALDDLLFRKELDIPILTLEEDRPGLLSRRSKTRIEAFISIIEKN